MRTPLHLTRFLLTAAVALSPLGCLEVEISTHLNSDGSLLRTEQVSGDSLELLSYGFISPVDSTWTITLGKQRENSYEHRATRLFRDAEEFSATMLDTDRNAFRVRAEEERRFLWFYTDITYRERYLKWNPFGLVPIGEYLTSDDIARSMNPPRPGAVASREDSIARETVARKWTEWMYRDMFEAYYAEVVRGVKLLNDPALPLATVAAHKEEIYRKGQKWWASAGSMDSLTVIVESIFRTPAAGKAIRANAAGFASHAGKLALIGKIMGKLKQVSIEMPGRVIDANAVSVQGNRGSWKGVSDMSYAADYELWMTTRVVNWWMVVLTAVVILGGLGALAVVSARH